MSDRHEETCYFCPESNSAAIEEHHLVPQRFNGSDEPENTVNLCGSCHDKIEDLYDDAFYERLGIAVEEAKQEKRTEVKSGATLQAKQTQDRKIPAESPHVQFEEWERSLLISEIVEMDLHEWAESTVENRMPQEVQNLVENEGQQIIDEYEKELVETEPYEKRFERSDRDVPEWVRDEGDEPVSFTYQPNDKAKHPVVEVENPFKSRVDQKAKHESEDASSYWEINRERTKAKLSTEAQSRNIGHNPLADDYPSTYRIHCGYCHTVFAEHEHADAAQHLRLRHGIENPYEVTDTTFREPTKESSPLLGRLYDNDE